jgi:hypothetical protein
MRVQGQNRDQATLFAEAMQELEQKCGPNG